MLLIATIEYVPLVKKLARKTSIKDKRSVTIDDDLPNLVCEAQAEKFRDCDALLKMRSSWNSLNWQFTPWS